MQELTFFFAVKYIGENKNRQDFTVRRFIILLFITLGTGLYASAQTKIGVITDTHYLSENLMDDGYALQDYIYTSGRNIKDVPAVLDKVLEDYLKSNIQVLLVCGDITKDGERQSHLDFVKKLKPLQDKGVKVFVIPGNHDINMPNPVEFKGNKALHVDSISPQDFTEIYAGCGYEDAVKRDTASLSYVAQLGNNSWLLAIDAARYEEYTTNSISGGRILPETEKWITEVLDEAKSKNIQVIGMMHWGITEHIMYQSLFFKEYLVNDWRRFATLFADKGMKAIFTGHFHANDISLFTSEAGNKIYDIETGTLSAYPYAYRFVDLYTDGMKIKTKNITSVPGNSNLAMEDKQRMKAIAENMALQKLRGNEIEFSPELIPQYADVLSQIFILHAFGDEKVDDKLRLSLKKLAETMESPFDVKDVELDFPPADNNVEIVF